MHALKINYGDITKSLFLDTELNNRFEKLTDQFPDINSAEIWLKTEGSSKGPKPVTFCLKMKVNIGPKTLFLQKANSNFVEAMNYIFKSVKENIKKRKEQTNAITHKRDQKRRNREQAIRHLTA